MKDYEKPWMEIVCISADVITDSEYECDVEGEGYCVVGDTANP